MQKPTVHGPPARERSYRQYLPTSQIVESRFHIFSRGTVLGMSSAPEPFRDPALLRRVVDHLSASATPGPGAHTRDAPHPEQRGVQPQVPDLGRRGIGADDALSAVLASVVGANAHLDHPGYMAHMDPPTPSIAQVGALLAAAGNQNLLHDDTGPIARIVEHEVVQWLASAIGMTGGHMVPGSSLANLTALWAAREVRGVKRVMASDQAHLSVRKAAHILGLAFTEIATGPDHQMRAVPSDLEDAALVVTAGTTATGAIDDLLVGTPAWRHVDAAWAGPLRLSRRHGHLLDGIERADSVSVSAHKWLYQPKESALVLFNDRDTAHNALSFGGGYLASPNVGLQGSHGFVALSLYLTALAWGSDGLAHRIEADMNRAEMLAAAVGAHDAFELRRKPVTGVVNWRPLTHDPDTVRAQMSDAFVSMTTIDGQRWFRSVAANPYAEPELVVRAAAAALSKVS